MRMALGATSGRIQRAVLVQTLRLAVIGLAAGTLASLGAAHLIASLLFATSPWDPAAYAAMAAFLLGIALLHVHTRHVFHIVLLGACRRMPHEQQSYRDRNYGYKSDLLLQPVSIKTHETPGSNEICKRLDA